jgi:hypothetical protein
MGVENQLEGTLNVEVEVAVGTELRKLYELATETLYTPPTRMGVVTDAMFAYG